MTIKLREAIVASGKSLHELSKLSGVSPPQLSRFVRGERGLTLSAADKICEVLNLELVSKPAPEKPRKSKRPAK